MLREQEQIIYVTQAQVVAYVRKDQQKEVKNAGFTNKKIVVTTQRLLIFQSLSNRLQETEYELTTTIAKKPTKNIPISNQKKPKISVNGFPQISVDVLGLDSKVIIEEQPAFYKFLQKQGIQNLIKSVIGVVLLKIPKRMRYYILAMGGISNAVKFAKAIICAQCWIRYMQYCRQMKIECNFLWVRILSEIIYNDDSIILIDPDLFITGSPEQINSFILLTTLIPFAHCFHHRYSITTPESASYAIEFISQIQEKIHSLSFKQAHLDNSNLKLILLKVTMANLIKLDLSDNNLQDEVLDILNRIMKLGVKKLSYINLSKNKIKLGNPQLLVQLLKAAATILNLDFSYNQIDDSSTEAFEKFVLFTINPPIEELNLSHNMFSRKVAWRLYVGNIRNFKSHPYLRFLLYPIPLKKQIFNSSYDIDFPRHNTTINLNMHSALIEQFEQQSLLKHTFQDIPATMKDAVTISFQRVLANGVKLPMNRQQLNRTLQISNNIENFIYGSQPVEKIYDTAMKLKQFPFEVPPISRQHFIRYLYQKFNQALFIRDHYSVKYLFKALTELQVSVEGYADRLDILKKRDFLYGKKAENILNFQIDEAKVNDELDQIVREGLRLYLQGHGIQIIYYLKYKRDQYIEKYLHEKLNPEHYLFDLMAKKNISADQRVSEKEFIIPYQIRLEKKINQNFYLHPWQANYQVLSQMKAATFDACLEFLEESEKKEKFALYFDRIQERIQFIKNQFTYFSYNKFKASYSDLKINACRLIYLYNNIKDTSIYLQIPVYVKKKLVTPERSINIHNKQWFRKQYHIVNYPNINIKARKANLYNYQGCICRYESQIFQGEVRKVLPVLNQIFYMIEVATSTRITMTSILPKIIEQFKSLVDIIRHSLLPQQLKEQLYLHIICWRKGRYGNNNELLHLIPAITMYIKPPLPIEKYLVAAILQNQYVDLQQLPLCLATNPNQPTVENIFSIENDFVERDWLPTDKIFCELFEKKGEVNLEIQMLEKCRITISVAESKTVAELMNLLVQCVQMTSEDRQHFWLYKLNKESQEIVAYDSRQHVGQIMADFQSKQSIILLKRRIYSRELKFNYTKYGENMINSLYHDIKYQYMCRNFFISDKLASEIAANIFIIEGVQNTLLELTNNKSKWNNKTTDEVTIQKIMTDKMAQLQSNFYAYVPKKIYGRLLKSKQTFITELKFKISEKFLKKQHNAIFEMKMNLLTIFSKFPEFMSSNHTVRSKEKGQMKISINAMYIYVEYESESQYIHLQKLVSIIPKSKYLLIYYHKQQNLVAQLNMFADQRSIFALAMDMFSYCSLRIKMSSINLYEIYHLEDLQSKIISLEHSLKKIYDKGVQKTLIKSRQQRQLSIKKISKMSLTLMLFKQVQYYNKNHYLKSEINRKLYANKTQKKLDFDKELDDDELNQIENSNKKILKMIFPSLLNNFAMEVQEEPDQKMTQKKFNDPNESMDFRKEYQKLNFETTLKKQEVSKPPPLSKIPVFNTPSKPVPAQQIEKEPVNNMKEENQLQQKVLGTGVKRGARGKKRRQ